MGAAAGCPVARVAGWGRVVGLQVRLVCRFADTPGRPVTGTDTLRLGGREIIIFHPGDAHSPGDLMIWLPGERVLFAGDILVADGVPMIVDGSSPAMLHALDLIDSLHPAVIVPGHGAIPRDPSVLVAETRRYFEALQVTMRREVADGHSMTKALASLPPADAGQPVTLNSRRRRNAVRVYLEMEKASMGLD